MSTAGPSRLEAAAESADRRNLARWRKQDSASAARDARTALSVKQWDPLPGSIEARTAGRSPTSEGTDDLTAWEKARTMAAIYSPTHAAEQATGCEAFDRLPRSDQVAAIVDRAERSARAAVLAISTALPDADYAEARRLAYTASDKAAAAELGALYQSTALTFAEMVEREAVERQVVNAAALRLAGSERPPESWQEAAARMHKAHRPSALRAPPVPLMPATASPPYPGHGQANKDAECSEGCCDSEGPLPQNVGEKPQRYAGSPEDIRNTRRLWSPESYAARKATRRKLANAEHSHAAADGRPRLECKPAARLLGCEGGGWLVQSGSLRLVLHPETGRPIRQPYTCAHRLCPWCARSRARALRAKLIPRMEELTNGAPVTMLTFTQLDIAGESLDAASARFFGSWGKFTRSQLWREHIGWAFMGCEVTRSTPRSRSRIYLDHKSRCKRGDDCRECARLKSTAAKSGRWWHVHGHLIVGAKACEREHCSTCTYLGTEPIAFALAAALGPGEQLDQDAAKVSRTVKRWEAASYREKRAALFSAHKLQRAALDEETGGGTVRSKSRRKPSPLAAAALEQGERKSWLEHSEMLSAWRSVGGGMVRVERPRGKRNTSRRQSAARAAAEAVKYITKPLSLVKELGHAELVELVGWMGGKRLMRTYGAMRGISDEDLEAPDEVAEVSQEIADGFIGVVDGTGELVTLDEVEFADSQRTWRRAAELLVSHAKGVDPPPPPKYEKGPPLGPPLLDVETQFSLFG